MRWAGFSPDRRQVATASLDHTLRLWDRASGHELLVLRGHRDAVCSACFVAGGRQLVSASRDGTLRWWWLRADDVRAAAEALGDEEVTAAQCQQFADLLHR